MFAGHTDGDGSRADLDRERHHLAAVPAVDLLQTFRFSLVLISLALVACTSGDPSAAVLVCTIWYLRSIRVGRLRRASNDVPRTGGAVACAVSSFVQLRRSLGVPRSLLPCGFTPFRRPAMISGGSEIRTWPPGSCVGMKRGRRMDPENSDLSSQVQCARCRRSPRDDADYVSWCALDDGSVCPGCLTMLETETHRETT